MTTGPGLIAVEYQEGYEIGMGVSSFNGLARGNAITWTSEPSGSTTGFTVDPYAAFATTREDFYSKLGVTSEASASYGLASVSAKLSFAESFKSTKLSSWIVIRVPVTQIMRSLGPDNNAALNDHALAILSGDGGALQFFQAYGDLFVVGVAEGAELVAVLQIESTSEESKKEVDSSWDANYKGGLSVETTGQINSVLATAGSTSSTEFRCHVSGGPGDAIPTQMTLEQVIAAGLKFPSTVTPNNAKPYTAYLRDYRSLGLPPGTHLDSPELEQSRKLLGQINGDLQDLRTKRSALQAILSHPERFTDTLAALRTRYQPVQDSVDQAIATLTSVANDCVVAFINSDDPQVPALPSVPTISIALPTPNPDPAFVIAAMLGPSPLVICPDNERRTPTLELRRYSVDDLSQRWIRQKTDDGHVRLITGDTKIPISAEVDAAEHLLHLVGDKPNDAPGLWSLTPFHSNVPCTISRDATGEVFEIRDGDAREDTSICLAAQNGTARQRWVFVPIGQTPVAPAPGGINLHGGYARFNASAPPCVIAFNGLFHAYVRDPDGQGILHRTSADGLNWTVHTYIGINTSAGPCAVLFAGQVHLFFRDPGGNGIFHGVSNDGVSFTDIRYIGVDCAGQPTAAVLNDTLCMLASDTEGNNGVMFAVATATP